MDALKPKKILYFITDLQIGGAQRELCLILPYLNRKKFDPIVVCLFGGNSLIAENIKNSGTPVVDLHMKNKLDLFVIFRFYKLLKAEKPAILHSSLFHASMVSRVVGKVAEVPIIITWRHNISHGNFFRDWINRITSQMDDCVVAVSNAVKEKEIKTSRINSQKVVVIYNGINTSNYGKINPNERSEIRRRWGIPEDAYLIGSIGRLHPSKGFDILLQSFKKIRSKIQNSWLILVGEGELRNSLEKSARNNKISECTVFTGTLTDTSEILSVLDVFIISSRLEGFPLVILEAMASQLPVIATNVGGIPEVIKNNETGILIEPNNPDAIVDRVIRIYHEKAMADLLGNAGRERIISEFDVIPIADQFQRLYSDLLSK